MRTKKTLSKILLSTAVVGIWLCTAFIFFPTAARRDAALREFYLQKTTEARHRLERAAALAEEHERFEEHEKFEEHEHNEEQEEGEEYAKQENPLEYLREQEQMLRNPRTGRIPDNAREMELTFAARMPQANGFIGKNGTRLQSSVWTPRGPFNVGGRVRALALDADNENTMLAGAASGGMWRSTDGGTSWARTTALSDISSVTCVAQDRRQGKRNVWYYGTGEFRGGNVRGGARLFGDGIFKSTDGGKSWSRLASTSRNQPHLFASDFSFIHKLVTDPTKTEDVVYAATYGGIWRSANGGETWTAVLGGNTAESRNRAEYSDVVITSTGILYAAISFSGNSATNPVYGIFRSTDGINWANISMPDAPNRFARINLGIAPSNENVMYVIAETPGAGFRPGGKDGHSLWKYTYRSGDGSGDGGGRWENRTENIPGLQPEGGKTGNFDSQNSYNMYVRVKPDNENVVFLGATELFRSTDGFATGQNTQKLAGYEPTGRSYAPFPNQHSDQHDLIFLPSNLNVAFTANDGGVRRTENILSASDEIEWKLLNNGFFSTQFYALAIDYATNGDNAITGGLQDNGSWSTESNMVTTAWEKIGSGDGAFCAIADKKSAIYYSSQNGNTSRLAGTRVARIDPLEGKGYLFINPFILDPNNSNIMFMAGGRDLWRNEDLSVVTSALQRGERYDRVQGWSRVEEVIQQGTISALAASQGSSTRLYFGTNQGQAFVIDNAHAGVMTPREITGNDFPQNGFITGVAVNPTNPDHALIVFSNYGVQPVFSTTDGGRTWTAVTGNLRANMDGTGAGPSCITAAFQTFGGVTRIFLGTSTGLYSTSRLDGMSTQWAQEGATVIGSVPVSGIAARQSDGYVAISTFANGMFSTNVTASATAYQSQSSNNAAQSDATQLLASAVVLKQNAPNPFSGTTTIRYSLPEAATVRLRITNTAGREITTLLQQPETAGEHSVEWAGQKYGGTPVEAGTYFYELSATLRNGVTVRRTGQLMLQK